MHNLQIPSHRFFAGSAARGKSSTGRVYGFKLHLAVNDGGEILGLYLTAGDVDERQPADWMTNDCWGKLVGDKGYLSKDLFEKAHGARLTAGYEIAK